MSIIIKNSGSSIASVEIVETATGKKDGVHVMARGKITLPAGWDITPNAILINPKLVVHRDVATATPARDAIQVGAATKAAKSSSVGV